MPEPRWTLGFVLARPFGIATLWFTGLLAAAVPTFVECFEPEDACAAVWQAQVAQRDVLVATVLGLTGLAVLAITLGRRRAPSALLVASLATLAFAHLPLMREEPWRPDGLFVLTPGLLILAAAAAGQILDWTRWHRRRVAEMAIIQP